MKKDIQVYSVSELTKDVRVILEDTFRSIWVEGEISNFTASSAGHIYFSLKDKSSVLNCVMFRSAGAKLSFQMKDGMQVLCSGQISVYDKRGQYQLYVKKVEPQGRGALQLAFEQLKEKLHKEGLFDETSKKPLPVFPVRVGVVTSPTGAAIRDILKVSRRRYRNVEITIRPVRVQGDEAKHDIVNAIKEFNEFNELVSEQKKEESPVDVLIVGRGGGSLEDLWAFNEEIVARAIFDSEIPVVSAVGHEIDYTVADFVADFRAATPSAAAELVVPKKEEFESHLKNGVSRIHAAMKNKIEVLESCFVRLKDSYVLRAPINVFLQFEQEIDGLMRSAAGGLKRLIKLKYHELRAVCGKMEALSPLAVLGRGYSITFKEGEIVKETNSLVEGDVICTRVAGGRIVSRVEQIEEGCVN